MITLARLVRRTQLHRGSSLALACLALMVAMVTLDARRSSATSAADNPPRTAQR